MESNYWILQLRLRRLFSLLRMRQNENISTLTYLEATKPASWALWVLIKLKRVPFLVKKVESRIKAAGPKLNMAWVRNDKGAVVTMDVFHHGLRIRMRIWEALQEAYKNLELFNGKPKDKDYLNNLTASFSVRIAEEINAAIYLAYYIRWKINSPSANINPSETKNKYDVLVIPNTFWSATVAEDLASMVECIVIDPIGLVSQSKRLLAIFFSAMVSVIKRVWFGLYHRVLKRGGKFSRMEGYKKKPNKLLVTYGMGLFKERRNDISYIHATDIPLHQLTLLLKDNGHEPSAEEWAWVKENNVSCVNLAHFRPATFISPSYTSFYRQFLNMFWQCLGIRKSGGLWLLETYWRIGWEAAYWKDIFIANDIAIRVHQVPGSENFVPNMAISELGGIAVIMERSMLFDYCTYMHNSPNHINFITGPYSLTQIPEPSFSTCTIQTGAINIGKDAHPINGLAQLQRNCPLIITIFDEMATDWFLGDAVSELYRSLVALVNRDSRFGLLIKTKKPQVLTRLESVYQELLVLESRGKCLLVDWKVSVPNAATNANMVVAVPSTAAFESILVGTRTILFNPMRCGSSVFYSNNGLNRRLFEESEPMVTALQRFADGTEPQVGDCSDLIPYLDPYNDGRGAERIGLYFKWCLHGFSEGWDRDRILAEANTCYANNWGQDKITVKNSYRHYIQIQNNNKK